MLAGRGGYKGYEHWQNYRVLNPVINSPKDVDSRLVQKILDNNIDSITINYEFTRCQKKR